MAHEGMNFGPLLIGQMQPFCETLWMRDVESYNCLRTAAMIFVCSGMIFAQSAKYRRRGPVYLRLRHSDS